MREHHNSSVRSGPHAVLWEKDGSVHDLGGLGGTVNTDLLGIGNVAFGINNRGQVVGVSALPGSTTTHAVLWIRDRGKPRDLGTLSGDVTSAGLGINDGGDVVGASIDGSVASGNPRAFLWRNGVMTDLNTLVPASTSLDLLTAFAINNAGEIAGFGATSAGDIHAFLATPCDRDHAGAEYCKDTEGASRRTRRHLQKAAIRTVRKHSQAASSTTRASRADGPTVRVILK